MCDPSGINSLFSKKAVQALHSNLSAKAVLAHSGDNAKLAAKPMADKPMADKPIADKPKYINFERNGFAVACYYAHNHKLVEKIERHAGRRDAFGYQFDKAGHLLSATINGELVERYQYNQAGQRIHAQSNSSAAICGTLHYDSQGRLIRAGDTSFAYNRHGALKQRASFRGTTQYAYAEDTLLNSATLPSGQKIVYEYDKTNPLAPVRKYKNRVLVAELQWHSPLCLKQYRNYEDQLDYTFISNKDGYLDKIRISPIFDEGVCLGLSDSDWPGNMALDERRQRLHAFLNHQSMEFKCGSDQVGTVKALFSPAGRVVKYIGYDSFGNVFYDSMPDLFIPVGFAGGLRDRDTGLIHFGFRDYDPTVGRFTAPDPLGALAAAAKEKAGTGHAAAASSEALSLAQRLDANGDHDPYDYCIDDPVTMNDPTGLIAPLLYFLGAALLGGGLGLGGAYGAALITDKIESSRTGVNSTKARDGVENVIPYVAEVMLNAHVPATWLFRSPAAGLFRLGTGFRRIKGDSPTPSESEELFNSINESHE